MSFDEQHRATLRAKGNRATAEQLIERIGDDDEPAFAALLYLLLAIEDRLAYGSQSVLDGTISCKVCRAIVLESNAVDHSRWHAGAGDWTP